MNDLLATVSRWWVGGDLLMPALLVVALILYTLLAERTLALLTMRRRQRRLDLHAVLGADDPTRSVAWRAWAGDYIALTEARELARGFAAIRALTACLPLLGLLGTVTGMVSAFDDLARTGLPARHTGIGLALTATQYGLALALPAVVWAALLGRRAQALADHRTLVLRQIQGAA